jgi:hypothetical protein
MGLRFENLDTETRRLMVAEIDLDAGSSGFYRSNHMTEAGNDLFPALLRVAAQSGEDDSLSRSYTENRCFRLEAERKKPTGGYTMVKVPHTAPDTHAQGQFNMYYMRALALRAQTEGKTITVYRARASENPRPGSEEMIGAQLDADVVLEILRRTKGVEPEIGIPMPNSGLTIHLA